MSLLQISTEDKSFPKVVLHERNKPAMGTNYVGTKTRLTGKRNITLREKSKETETNVLDNKIRKYERAPIRTKKQHISSENSNRKKIIPERKNVTKSMKSEKGSVKKSDISKSSDVIDRNVTNLNNTNDYASKDKSDTGGGIDTLENMSNNCYSGLKIVSPDGNKIPKTHSSDCQNSVPSTNETCGEMMFSEHCGIDISLSEHDLELSQMSESSIQNNVTTKLKDISSSTSSHILLSKSDVHDEIEVKITSACSDTRTKTSLKKSIPKPQSVILSSCDSQHKNFRMPDVNKDTSCISNTSDLQRQDSNKQSDLDQIESFVASNCKQSQNLISHSKECTEQTVELYQNAKLSAQNNKPEKKSQKSSLQGSVPSYLRMTSSAANKEIKKKSENIQRSATQENSTKQNYKGLNAKDLKCSVTKKKMQPGLKSVVKSNVKENQACHTAFVDDRKSSSSSPEGDSDVLSHTERSVMTSSTSSETETTTKCLNNNANTSQNRSLSLQSQQVQYAKQQNVRKEDMKSSTSHKLKLPVRSKTTTIPKVSKESVTKKQNTTSMDLNTRPRSLTPTDSKSALITLKRHTSQDTSLSSRSRSTTPGASSVSSDSSCSNNAKLSSKTMKQENIQTKAKKPTQMGLKGETTQKQKSAINGLITRPRSLTPTDSKSLSFKRQTSQDTISRSRSTTPGASSISCDGISLSKTKISSKTLDLHPHVNNSQQVFKPNQDIKLTKISNKGLQTSNTVKTANRDLNRGLRLDTQMIQPRKNNMSKINKTKADVEMISNRNKMEQSTKGDPNSRSRSNTSGVSSTKSGNSSASSLSKVPQSRKESSPNEGQNLTNKSNVQLESANISSPSESKSSSADTSPSDKARYDEKIKDRDSKSQSRSNTPGTPSTSPGNASYSKKTKADSTTTKTGRNSKSYIDSYVKSNVKEANNVSQESKGTKQETTVKRFNANAGSAESKTSSKTSPRTAMMRTQTSKNNSEIDRKSRSRSSTPGSSSLNKCSNMCKGSDHKHEQEKKPTSDKITRVTRFGLNSKIPRDISANSRKSDDKKVQKSITGTQKDKTPASGISKNINEQCNVSTNREGNKQYRSNVIKTVHTLKPQQVSSSVDSENSDKYNTKFSMRCSSTQSDKSVVNSISDKDIPEPRTITVLDSKQQYNESYDSLPTISENSTQSKAVSGIYDSKSKSSNKTKMLSTQELNKPITELTGLSVKTDSRIKSGKIQNSVKYKKSQLQESLDNRSRQESGRTNIENKAIKTPTSGNKLRQAHRMSAIKNDDISTKPRFKSKGMETRKQNSQLSGKLTLCHVNSVSETEGVYVTDELIGGESCQTLEEKEVSSMSISNNQNSEVKETIKLDLTDRIQKETAQKKSDDSKAFNLNQTDTHKNSNLLLEQSAISCEINNYTFSNEQKYSECPENVKCMDFSSRKYQFATCAQCRDINSSDRREANARDPKSKVTNNCLSDVRENEIQQVSCEINTGIYTEQDENANCECELSLGRKYLKTCQNEMDLKTDETVYKMESRNLNPCSNCSRQDNSSLSYIFENGDTFLCDSCKDATENDSNIKSVKDDVTILNSCVSYNKNDLELEYSTCKCHRYYNKLKYFSATNFESIPTELEQQCSHDSVCQCDKKSETSTFKIDTYDVSSSNEMPITEGSSFKHTYLSDLQEDKEKCTHAMPITGAASFQSTNKRQDKTIASLSNCGKHNPALCSNKNYFLRDADKFIVPHFDSCECAKMEQGITSIERENGTDVLKTASNTSINSNNTDMNDVVTSKNCVDSIKAEQNISDWNKAELLDITPKENESKLQVMNNCEINKGTSEPKHSSENLESRENLSCDNMNNIQALTDNVSYTDGMSYGKSEDINVHNMDSTAENGIKNFQCDNSKQNSSCFDENVYAKINTNDNENGKEGTCIQFNDITELKFISEEESPQEKALTCSSDSVKGITFPDDENTLPERNSRTMDVKLIRTDHDLSADSHRICSTNVSINSAELCHTELLFDKNDTLCDYEHQNAKDGKNSGKSTTDEESAINGTLTFTDFLQNQLQRLKPGGYLSEAELKKDMTCKPYVLEAQEKQTNCIYNRTDAQCLFVKESNIKDGLIMFHCENENSFQTEGNDTIADGQNKYFQDKEYLTNDSDKNAKNKSGMHKLRENESKCVHNSDNSSFCSIQKLSELICTMYPNLKEKTKLCSETSNKKEINQEDKRCSYMTQNANLNTCFSNMKLNDSACLFQSYTQLDRDDIKVSSECLHCADLSQTTENLSNSYSKKLHSHDDLTEANSAEHGSLEITGNKLCTGSIPCDGNKGKISTHIILSKSTENQDLNDLSLPFDVCEDINSGWTMSRDCTRVALIDTELSSELSVNLTDCETLNTHNHGPNQDCYEDKESGELSAVKITTQKSSCNLKFSEKSNEPKDLLLRYEHHKNSAGHKKIYSCKDELDIGIASTQEEYNFRNLAAIRDEDINCEIKLNNINIETPKHCVSSSFESARPDRKVISTGIQEQCSETETNLCSVDKGKYFETPNRPLTGQLDSDKESNCLRATKADVISNEGTVLSCDNDLLSENIRLSGDNPEQLSYTSDLKIRSVEKGLLQENSIKTNICQTAGDVNALLTLHKAESIPKLNLPGKFINSVSGVECAKNKYTDQTNNQCHGDINVSKDPEPSCVLDVQECLENKFITNAENITQKENINTSTKNQDLSITIKNFVIDSKDSSLQGTLQPLTIHDCIHTSSKTNDNLLNAQENLSPSEETLSDASEAFTDAEDRLSSPNTEIINTFDSKHGVTGNKEFNISCGASTSTESFVDAVESLDDDYLTTTNFRTSREIENEETVSQNSSGTNDSSTGIAGSIDDLSGWEEFSENIEDINDYNGDMEAKSCAVTKTESNHSQFCLTDGQTHAPVCITKHVFHDKNYQSPSPPSEPAEIYLSKIKTNTLRYKDMRNGAEQKVIGSSIFEIGNGGTIKDIDVTGVRSEANNVRNVTYKAVYHTGDSQDNTQILSTENEIQPNFDDSPNIPPKFDKVGNATHKRVNTISTIETDVGSKIEAAVIKRTERRRRRQIEQQKCTACDSKSEDKLENNALNIRQREQARDNECIEKNSCSHSEHSKYSCTVSDNTTFNNEQASGTGELQQHINIGLNLNESNLDHSLNSGTPLNYDCDDYVTNEVSVDMDKTDKIDTIDVTDHTSTDKNNEIKTQLVESFICEKQCERNFDLNNTITENGIHHDVKHDKVEVKANSEVQLTIEFQEHVQRNEVDLDDIEFIDADESNQEGEISPNVSFTFSLDENIKDINNDKYDGTSNEDTKIYSGDENMQRDNTVNFTELKPNSSILNNKKDTAETHSEDIVIEESTVLEEVEVSYEKTTLKTSGNRGDSLIDMKGIITDDEAGSLKVEESTAPEIILDSHQNNAYIDIEADVCEESNISVRLALELEKQKLADDDENRSRKGLFMSKRAGRRATIETCSFENREDAEKILKLGNDKDTKGKPEIKKSKSFRVDRKQISPIASFMNPPDISESSDGKDNNDDVDSINKKVSDICKSFMTKTRSSAQKTRAKTLSKSPAPQRKLMKWVNNNGKWMRMPVEDTVDNSDETTASSSPSDHSATSASTENYSPVTPEITINIESSKTVAIDDNESEAKTGQSSVSNDTIHTISTTQGENDQSKTNVQSNQNDLNGDTVNNACNTEACKTTEAQNHEDTRATLFVKKTNSPTKERVEQDTNRWPTESEKNVKICKETDSKQKSDALILGKDQNSNQSENLEHISNTDESSRTTAQLDAYQPTLLAETDISEPDDEPEMKVIGTTFDDAQSDQEKHRQRQELLFGLLDSFNRRKPRRLTPHESIRNIQSAKKSHINNDANNIEIQCSDNSNVQKQEIMSDNNLKSIPKIKAIKIQEEVFECKTEYLKDTNICKLPEYDVNVSKKELNENRISKKNGTEKGADFKALKLPIRKSKTFAGLGDIERNGHISRRLIGKENVQSDAKNSHTVDEINENRSAYNDRIGKNELHDTKCTNTMTDKRVKAGLKLNLDKTKARMRNDFEMDRSPNRLGPEQSRGRSSGDRSPNRLCVDQSKVRLRSPDKGPRQLQRYKLLSEIVEVEEKDNKDDVTVTCERRQQQQYFSDRQRPEGPKPVKRSNKRRSLSLPTGTLAFGDARIVYKNGHFTIETMDNSEYDCNEPSDYHSSSQQLDGNIDDMWEMPDTGGDYSKVKGDSREASDIHNKPHMRRQNAKTVLKSSDSTEDVFYSENEFLENVSPYKININGDSKVLNMGRTSEEVFNESCSSRASDMSIDSYYSEGMDLSTDESVTDSQKLSSSSLPDTKDVELKRVMQRAKRTSSFRAAQEGGALRLSGIDEDTVHNSTRARSVSLDESQKSDLNKSPKIQNVQNQNPTFLKKVMAKRKTRNENLNMSGFSKQSESAKEFFTKKMTLKGLFRKNKSDSSVNSPIKTEHPVSPPIATFQDDDIGSVDTPPSSPYRGRNLRRRHTSADILKTYPDSSETDSNCPTPTQERSNKSRHSISSPSTPSHEANSLLNLTSHSSAPQFRDDDEMSVTSASSFASSIHSPPLEQPHKPKTPKPVGASPRRNQSFSFSRSSSQSSRRNVMNSVTSLESDQYESLQDDVVRDPRCECVLRSEERKRRMSNRNIRGSTDSITMCQFCKQMEFYKSDSVFYKPQLTGKEKQSEDSARIRKDSSGRNNYDRLGIISQADVASSNSNDSGIQRDASVHSSNESIKGTADTRLRLRRNKSLSPHPDRPKSEISVRWADGDSGDYDITETTVKLRNKSTRDRPRPKSDLDGSSFLSDRMKAFGSEINLQPYCSLRSLYEMKRNDLDRQKNRRMSTPHPIKSRLQRAPQKLHKQPPLVRSSSMPESLEKIHKRRKMHHLLDFHLDSLSRHMDIDALSDESDLSFDRTSLQERSVSVQSSSSQLTTMDEDEDNLTYAEALWDHITMDPEELGFRAQDLIEVLDMADKDWWFGVIDDREGWFPATFVRIRVNQDQLEDDLDLDTTIQDNLTTSPKLRRISMFNKNQARSNVVNEIINAEREYVKHLKDVVEGYIQHARKRTEMFPEERIALIFGNLEKIYSFAQKFVSQLEMCIDVCPHLSEIGQCFLDNERGFEIYSDYCNNHPSACEELDELCKDSKYKHFFEACRLLQELVEIPLEGFLLTPVQKICKYPLQLAELLKYTPPDHPDYTMVKDALAAMRKIATLINERKRKMESIEKIAVWQHSVVDWEGPDLLVGSSELIFSGELNKINTAGWSQERFFFLFDHQVVYCKKELLKRHVFSYKGRIDLDHCDIIDIPDGKDSQYNVTVKHAWKFHETHKDKWYLIYAKSEAVKQSWLKAIRDERQRVMEDQENDFCVPDHWKQTVLNKVRSQSNLKDKQSGGRMSHGQLLIQKDLKDFTYSTLPRHRISQKHAKKKGWFNFGGGKKSKR